MLAVRDNFLSCGAGVTSHKFQNLPQKLAEHAHHHRLTGLSFRCTPMIADKRD